MTLRRLLDSLLNPRGGLAFDLEADLRPVSGDHRASAEVEFKGWRRGDYHLEVEVDRPGGTLDPNLPVSVVVDSTLVGRITLDPRGRTRFSRTHLDGPLGFHPALGQTVALGQNGVVKLSGRFERD